MKKFFTLLSSLLLCLGANAQAENLADVIKDALAGSTEQVCPVFLDAHKSYELNSYVDLGTKAVIIWGGEATIVVSGEGQLASSTFFEIRNANFDCVAAEAPIFGMSKEPDASLKINDETSEIKFEGANQKVFWNADKFAIVNCKFSGLKKSLVYANKQPWAIKLLMLKHNIVQLEGENIDPVINWYGSSSGAIKHLWLEGNTIYNISAANESSWLVRMGNASNAQPQKIWGPDATSVFSMYNNTIAFPGKALANNFPNKNNVTLDWKKNIFINTPYLQKTASSAVRTFTAEDNILYFNNGKEADATDKAKYGTVEEIDVDVPETTLVLNGVDMLKRYFRPVITSNAANNGFGAHEWAYPFKTNIAKLPGYAYEVVLGPDMLAQYPLVANCDEKNIGVMKPGINTTLYPWIEYVRQDGLNTLSNGQNEAQQSNRWTDLNPVTDEEGTWLQVTGKNGSVNCPVVGGNNGKCLKLYVKGVTNVTIFATGSASGSAADGNAIVVNAISTEGTEISAKSGAGSIYGKGTKSTSLDLVLIEDEGFEITITSANKDIQITGIRLDTDDDTIFPVCHAPGEKYPGTNYEVVLGPDMLAQYALVDNPETTKPGINVEEYPWITYVRGDGLNVLTNGQNEAQQSNRWTDLNPVTGEKGTWLQATGKNGSVNSPVISAEWNKYMTVAIQDATKFKVYATGSASTTEATQDHLILTATANDGTQVVAATTPGTIWGKGKASDAAELILDPMKAYVVKIESAVKDIQITGFNLTGTDLTVAPKDEDPALGDVTGIEEVKTEVSVETPAYNLAGQRVNANAKGIIIKNGKAFIVK